MFFRPSFCANCGEKIERADWGILTSRRFCQVCETEFKGQDLIPRAIVAGGIVLGIVGFSGYLRSGNATPSPVVQTSQQRPQSHSTERSATPAVQAVPEVQSSMVQPKTLAANASNSAPKAKPETEEAAYYCGAETKKGTACTRRVKGNVRCFQHKGMPAMLPADQLRIG